MRVYQMRMFRKIAMWILAALLFIVIAVPIALYVPAIQTFVKDIALREIRKSTGMDITVESLRLRFPMRLSLDRATVVEADGDTMLRAGNIRFSVAMLPLLKGDIQVTGAHLTDIFYQTGAPDSAIWLKADIRDFDLDGAAMNLGKGTIDVDRAVLDGGKVSLMINDSVPSSSPADTSASRPLIIRALDISLLNVDYRMTMMPVIDSLGATIPAVRLRNGLVDMATRTITAQSLAADSLDVAYITPSAEYLKTHGITTAADTLPENISASADSLLWTITAGHITLNARRALYAQRDVKPLPGLDLSYIEASAIAIEVDSMFNRGSSIRVPLRSFHAAERCGIALRADGTFAIDSTGTMSARDFRISTDFSTLDLDAEMKLTGDTSRPSPLRLYADARIAPVDIRMAFPAMTSMIASLPAGSDMSLKADIDGTTQSLDIHTIEASVPRILAIEADGRINHPLDTERTSGRIDIKGRLTGLNTIKPSLLDARLGRTINLPHIALKGHADFSPRLISGLINATSGDGRIVADGSWQQSIEGYQGSISLDRFPIASFLPEMGIGDITADIRAKGRGLDPLSASTRLEAEADIHKLQYQGQEYSGIDIAMQLSQGIVSGHIDSNNPGAELGITFDGTASREGFTWSVDGDINSLDLLALKLAKEQCAGSLTIKSRGNINADASVIDATLSMANLDWNMTGHRITAPTTDIRLITSDSTVNAGLTSGDLSLTLATLCGLDTLITRATALPAILDTAIARRNADIIAIQRALPPLNAILTAGSDNILTDLLAASGTGFRHADMRISNDSLMNFNTLVTGFHSGDTRLDTLRFGAVQHGKYLAFNGALDNRPGTLDQWAHVRLTGYLADDRLSLLLRQRDINDREGFFLGANLAVDDSVATLRFVPYSPVIGYKKWQLNQSNFITYNLYTRHIDADLEMGSGQSLIRLYTEHNPGNTTQEDLIVQLKDIQIQDWLTISPFAPPVKGSLAADMRISAHQNSLTGTGNVSLDNLYYGRERVGSFDIGLDVGTDRSGRLTADASLKVDSIEVITAVGSLNDTASATPFHLDFEMIRFPMRVANPFLPKNMARLSGMLNGRLDITGSLTRPILNGYLDFDTTAVSVGMLGTSFKFSEDKIPVDSSIVIFDNFAITAANKNPLTIDGTVDLRDLTDIAMNLGLKAKNMQIVNSSRPKNADVYGRAFIDLDATVKGDMRFIAVNADLNLLPGTNVTYVIPDVESALTSQSTGDMVKFVNFADTTAVAEADTLARTTMIGLDATLTISQGSTINVDLSADGKNRATVAGYGTLDYTMSPLNDGRLTGRFTINSGFVRYTPPMMSEKKFEFDEGSYVAFNGDMLNPILNIHATDRMKANVTQTGQNSRLINFDIALSVTNTLQNMNVAFDLSTDDDITVQNELASMSQQQRANQAMNLLLYNTYTGPGTKASTSLSGNPLYSFLTSQINSWAAQNIRGVDISFGIDQYNQTTDGASSTTTSYSYRVSKNLFNDRVKIIVGGNYSTDADTDENFQQNLINDIAFEYMLNKRGTMIVRIFRHNGYESILEGEITETGVGFVMRRKINSLKDLFRWAGRLRRSLLGQQGSPTVTTPAETPSEPITSPTHDNK